jgi:hypothetical protein
VYVLVQDLVTVRHPSSHNAAASTTRLLLATHKSGLKTWPVVYLTTLSLAVALNDWVTGNDALSYWQFLNET